MFLQPKKTKYKKTKKGRLCKLEFKKNKLKFGTVGLKATILESSVPAKQKLLDKQSLEK